MNFSGSCKFSQLVPGNSGNISAALQQIQAQTPLTTVTTFTRPSAFTLLLPVIVLYFYSSRMSIPPVVTCFTHGVCRTSRVKLTWAQLKKVCLWNPHQSMDKQFYNQSPDSVVQVMIGRDCLVNIFFIIFTSTLKFCPLIYKTWIWK